MLPTCSYYLFMNSAGSSISEVQAPTKHPQNTVLPQLSRFCILTDEIMDSQFELQAVKMQMQQHILGAFSQHKHTSVVSLGQNSKGISTLPL